MIVLFTDFGFNGPYLGQMKAVIWQQAPQLPIIDLFADAPAYNPRAGAWLLASYAEAFPAGTVFLAVVDPGVGSAARRPAIIRADGRWYVGPDNGLFNVVAGRAAELDAWHVAWQPERLSASFHGRDLFAPLAAQLALGAMPEAGLLERYDSEIWRGELFEVIYVDHFGNLITGVRAASLDSCETLHIGDITVPRARTFSDVAQGAPLCYENANCLLEIAVNQGRADEYFGVGVGEPVYPAP
jgi:S-adenosylmethionine hydrolase